MNRTLLTWLLVTSITLLSVCPVAANGLSGEYIPAATGISLSIDFGNGTVHEYTDLEGIHVFEVTNSTTSTEVDWYGEFVYVTAISGVRMNENTNQFWQYRVNGELGGIAANAYVLEDGDSIEWYYTSNTSEVPTEPQFDYSLIIGGVILAFVSVGVLLILWVRQNRW